MTNTNELRKEESKLRKLVSAVSSSMIAKLLKKAKTHGGWDDPDEIPYLKDSLRDHFACYMAGDDSQLIDCLNLMAMLFWHLVNSKEPIEQAQVFRQSSPRATMIVSVWPCPVASDRYSFSVATKSGGVMAMNEFEGDSCRSGNFETVEEAIAAGKSCALED